MTSSHSLQFHVTAHYTQCYSLHYMFTTVPLPGITLHYTLSPLHFLEKWGTRSALDVRVVITTLIILSFRFGYSLCLLPFIPCCVNPEYRNSGPHTLCRAINCTVDTTRSSCYMCKITGPLSRRSPGQTVTREN